ncbi:MAG TPA: DUF5615 family PIN-like protein [Bryobacteraceae bacterium]|nr:DUF5615 family PIN-like protein [Bryobacteraceae bacterium]
MNAKIVAGLRRREPSLEFQSAKAANLLGRPDLDVLAIAAQSGRILVSHDRETMPAHFGRFVRTSQSAGLLIVSQSLDLRQAIEQLLLVWAASEAEEWTNTVAYLPL